MVKVQNSFLFQKLFRIFSISMGGNACIGFGTVCLCILNPFVFHFWNSYPDFFGIMTSYQECCIYAVSLKKGRDNMEYFLLNSVFFKRYNSGKSRDNLFYKSLKMLDLFRNVKEKNPFSSKIAFFI